MKHADILIGAVFAAAFLAASAALAQQGGDESIEEIVVTATKRDTALSDVPFSINARTAEDLRRSGAQSMEDIARGVAGLNIQNYGPGQTQVTIRGVSAGEVRRDQPGAKEQVGIYMDESVISLSLYTPELDLYDLNRVETLRGPQGTLFGAGSIGGTVRYITNQPNPDAVEGSLFVEYNKIAGGSVGSHLKGMYNVPFGDDHAMRFVFYRSGFGGWVDARGEGGTRHDDVNDGDRTGFRLSARFDNGTSVFTPRLIWQETSYDGFNREDAFNFLASPFTTPAVNLGENEQYLLLDEGWDDTTMIFDLTAEWELGNDASMTFVTSLTERDAVASRDASALTGSVGVDALGFLGDGEPRNDRILLPSNLRDTTELTQLTHELRIAGTSGSMDYVAGLFYADIDRDFDQRLPTPGYDTALMEVLGLDADTVANGVAPVDSPYAADVPVTQDQSALFAEVTFRASERLGISVGGRFYDYDEERTFHSGGVFANADNTTDATSTSGFNGRLILSYEMSPTLNLNAQISQGFRLGGVNDPLNVTLCQGSDLDTFGGFQSYDDEELTNYEVGLRGNYGRTRFSASVFQANIDNLQTTLDAGSCSSRLIFNVPEAVSSGLEFELWSELSEHFSLQLSAMMVTNEFRSTVLGAEDAMTMQRAVLGGIQDGNRLASSPQSTATASLQYSVPLQSGSFSLDLSWQMVGDQITQPSDQGASAGAGFLTDDRNLDFRGATGEEDLSIDILLPEYSLINLRAAWELGEHEVAFYINNLTDTRAQLSLDRERGGRARLAYRTNQPRTVGFSWHQWF